MQGDLDGQTGSKPAEIMGTFSIKAEGMWVACPSQLLSTTEGSSSWHPNTRQAGLGWQHRAKKVPASG